MARDQALENQSTSMHLYVLCLWQEFWTLHIVLLVIKTSKPTHALARARICFYFKRSIEIGGCRKC
jgi:hypothetical protein